MLNSGQHAEAVRRTFAEFEVRCDVELPALPCSPNLAAASARLIAGLEETIVRTRPSLVVVQGDTLTAYAGARAAARTGYPVAHVEAGLRAPTASDPFPEEWFRRRIARHADLHFAPSDSAYFNLVAEGVPGDRIHRTGNTGIDSLRALLSQRPVSAAIERHRRALVTLHRRENWDSKADTICDALIEICERVPDLRMLVPVHPNPRIAPRLRKRLGAHERFELVSPLAYREFIAAAASAALVISDSGGIQEEVAHLGVPLIVPRSCTERPEGVATGFVRIVGTERAVIVREALAMLAQPRRAPLPFDRSAPFGDGEAASRIVDVHGIGPRRRGGRMIKQAQSSLAASPAGAPRPDGPLATWLRNVAQCTNGPHAGAVAGCISVSGTASYVYPEIAGYYLTWLAWRASRFGPDPDDGERARGVQRWLAKWVAMPGLPTRVHFDGTSDDWRNRALFCFDLAMVLRGLAATGRAGLLAPDPAVVDGVCRALVRLIGSDGTFEACLPNGSMGTIPDRWSTRRGPFLAKAAAGLMRASEALAIPPEIRAAADRTFECSVAQLAREPHRETHPLLYAFEGVLDMPRHPRFADALPSISAQFDMLLAYASHDAHLPETLGCAAGNGPARVDVMAQTLRVGYLLSAHRPHQPPDRVGLARIRQSLSRQVRPGSGGVAFARSAAPAQSNVWATMFADQALAFAAPARGPDAWWRSDPLIV